MVGEIESRIKTKLALAERLLLTHLISRYDDNEPRDDHGEWTSGGGSSANEKEVPVDKDQVLHHSISFGSKEEQEGFLAGLKSGGNILNSDERLDVSKGKQSGDSNSVHLQIDAHKSATQDQSGAHFKPGASFKATSVEQNLDGSKTVHLKEAGTRAPKPTPNSGKPDASKISSEQAAKNVKAGKDPELEKACVDWVSASGFRGAVGFTDLNKNPNSDASQRVRAQFDKLTDYKSSEPLYRSMSFNSPDQRDAFLAKLQVGQKFPTRGMAMSTTKDKTIAQNFAPNTKEFGNYSNNRVHIEIQDHKTGKDLSPLLDNKEMQVMKQKEVAFLSGTKFQIVSIDRKSNQSSSSSSVYNKKGNRVDVSRFGKVNAPWDSVTKIVIKQID